MERLPHRARLADVSNTSPCLINSQTLAEMRAERDRQADAAYERVNESLRALMDE